MAKALITATIPVVVKSVFKKFDSDDSGRLNASEFHQACCDLGYVLSLEEAMVAFKYVDEDSSGLITEDEFVAWWIENAKEKKLGRLLDPEYLKLAEAVSKCFVYFDKDRSGTIETAELGPLLKHCRYECTDAQVAELATALDTNGDKHITFSEFMKWYYKVTKGHAK